MEVREDPPNDRKFRIFDSVVFRPFLSLPLIYLATMLLGVSSPQVLTPPATFCGVRFARRVTQIAAFAYIATPGQARYEGHGRFRFSTSPSPLGSPVRDDGGAPAAAQAAPRRSLGTPRHTARTKKITGVRVTADRWCGWAPLESRHSRGGYGLPGGYPRPMGTPLGESPRAPEIWANQESRRGVGVLGTRRPPLPGPRTWRLSTGRRAYPGPWIVA